jgi:putative SOS response-associated peptidase YedK
MCGRYAFFSPAEAVRHVFGVAAVPPLERRYNIAPTQPVPVVRERDPGEREVALLHWGLVPSWAKDKAIGNRMINARAETLAEKPAYRRAFRSRRCLVLADGWYEWQAGASGKQPWFICARDRQPLGLAGLWETWRDPGGGEVLESCTIVTRDAPGRLGKIHHRMPAVIPPDGMGAWLDPGQGDAASLSHWLGEAQEEGFEAWPVSRAVNDPRHEGAGLIAPERA